MFTFTIFWRLCKTVIFYSYMFAWIHLENHLGLGFLCRKIFTYDSFILLVLGIFKVFLFLLGLVLVYFLGICLVCLIFPISWYKVAYFLLSSSLSIQFSSVQLLSHVRLFATPWTAACQASLSITNSWSSPKPLSTDLVMPSNHLILRRPLLLLPSIFPSIRVFSNESALCIRWPNYWSFSFSISPSNEHPGLISFRMDWLDLLAVQGTLKSLLQHHSSKASILWHSPFFIVQLSHPLHEYWKNHSLD